MISGRIKLLFTKFVLVSLIVLSAPLQAAFSFTNLYNLFANDSLSGKKASEKVIKTLKASTKPKVSIISNIKNIGQNLLVGSFVALAIYILFFKKDRNNSVEPEPNPVPRLVKKEKKMQMLLRPEFIIDKKSKPAKRLSVKEQKNSKTKKCMLCLDDKNPVDFYKMSCCDFEFCRACLIYDGDNDGIISKAIRDKNINLLKCPNTNCPDKKNGWLMRDVDIKNLASEQDLIDIEAIKKDEKLRKLSGFRHCSTPDCPCSYVIPRGKDGKNLHGDIVCQECNIRRCANCQISHFGDETCEHAMAEKEKLSKLSRNGAEAATEKALIECPKCRYKIFKDGGCKHMTCVKADGGCGFNFCSDCLGYLYGRENGGFPHAKNTDGGSTARCPLHPELVDKSSKINL